MTHAQNEQSTNKNRISPASSSNSDTSPGSRSRLRSSGESTDY